MLGEGCAKRATMTAFPGWHPQGCWNYEQQTKPFHKNQRIPLIVKTNLVDDDLVAHSFTPAL